MGFPEQTSFHEFQALIYKVATKGNFLAWLRRREPEDVNSAKALERCTSCPVAMFLKEMTGEPVRFNGTELRRPGDWEYYKVPSFLVAAATKADTHKGYPITGGELAIWVEENLQ